MKALPGGPRQRTGVLAALVFGALLAAGCRPAPSARRAAPQRIVAVAPNLVEILFELGLAERVAGVGSHCMWPPEVAGKPRIGGLLDPRLEEIAALEPDLAILLPSEQSLAQALEGLGIEVLVTPIETLDDIVRTAQVIGHRVGKEASGRELAARLREAVAPSARGAGIDAVLVVGREPGSLAEIYVAGSGTFLDELLARLGGVNVLADSPVRYPRVSLEEILSRAPRVVIELQSLTLSASVRAQLIADWEAAMPASPPCVTILEGDHVLVPGPRVGLLYKDLAEGLDGCV